MPGGGKVKSLLKKAVNAGKKKIKSTIKKETSKGAITGRVVDAVKEAAKDKSRSTRRGKKSVRVGIPRDAEPDVTISKNIELKGNRKKRKAKKKIAKWKSQAKPKMTEQQKFLAMDKKNK